MFLSSVSGGLIALGLVATATRLGTAFYAFGLVLLPLLAFVGVVSFERTLQNGVEDHGYARRIARLRAYYFDEAPELLPYLLSVPATDRLAVMGILGGRWQAWRTIAGMIAVITAALAASAAGLLAAVASDHSLAAAGRGRGGRLRRHPLGANAHRKGGVVAGRPAPAEHRCRCASRRSGLSPRFGSLNATEASFAQTSEPSQPPVRLDRGYGTSSPTSRQNSCRQHWPTPAPCR